MMVRMLYIADFPLGNSAQLEKGSRWVPSSLFNKRRNMVRMLEFKGCNGDRTICKSGGEKETGSILRIVIGWGTAFCASRSSSVDRPSTFGIGNEA